MATPKYIPKWMFLLRELFNEEERDEKSEKEQRLLYSRRAIADTRRGEGEDGVR